MKDTNRRTILKSIGTMTAATTFGTGAVHASQGEDIAAEDVKTTLEYEEAQAALDTADIDHDSLEIEDATKQTVDSETWIDVPVTGKGKRVFSYNSDERLAEIKVNPNTLVRAQAKDKEVSVEKLTMSNGVTSRALATLEDDADYEAALEEANVDTVMTDDAAAHVDEISGITRVFLPVEFADESEQLLLIEIEKDDSLEAVYGLPTESEIGTMGIECWASCITVGRFCRTVCSPCLSAPTKPTCTPCAVCIGGSATACAVGCGISQFW